MLRRRSWALPIAVGAMACHTTPLRDDSAQTRTSPPDAAASAAPSAGSSAPFDAAARSTEAPPAPQAVTALYPVVEGACPPAHPYAVGATPVFVVYRDAWAMDANGARAFYRMGPPVYDKLVGATLTADHIGDLGGPDEAHAWIQLRLSTGRGGGDASEVYIRESGWKRLETPRGTYGFFGLTHAIPQPDGSLWTFGVHSIYLDIPGDSQDGSANHDRYFAFSAKGEALKINLPGPDMAAAVRLPSGELLAAGRTSASRPVLRRWSPVKKVDDLVVPDLVAEAEPSLLLGTARAVLLGSKQKRAFYNYVGDKLVASSLGARVREVASWLVTKSDDLMVTTSDGLLFVESKDGAVTEEKLPEPGRLAAEPSAPWLLASSGALYTRAEAGWRKIALPDGPWTAESHPPSRVEWVKVIGGETWASAVRTDLGFGLRKAGEVRVLYASSPRPAPLRCGAPFPATTWAPLPPRPGPSCSRLAVVVASEDEKESRAGYPKLGAALKGDARLGESLVIVRFGKGPDRLVAVLADSMELAGTIAKRLERVSEKAPEIVCGTPDEDRRMSFRVATGAFTTP